MYFAVVLYTPMYTVLYLAKKITIRFPFHLYIKPMYCGVQQGSILGPVLFNLYVVEVARKIESASIQYADNTTSYHHCKIANISKTIAEMQSDVQKLASMVKG